MKKQTRDLLERADDPVQVWNPIIFCYDELVQDIEEIQGEIKLKLAIDLKRDGQVQDATYLDDIYVPLNTPEGIQMDLAIRFSNFGRLFVIFSSTNDLKRYPVDRLVNIIEAHGWHCVEIDDLDKAYDGRNPSFKGETWWVRFFDFL